MVTCIFAILIILSLIVFVLSMCFEWEKWIFAFSLGVLIFSVFAFAVCCANSIIEDKQDKCIHSFIACRHKHTEHTEFSLCEAVCVNCEKEIGIFTPKEIYEYNLSHR